MKRIALIPLAVFALLVGLFAAMLSSERTPEKIESARVGGTVPAFTLPALRDGDPALASDQLGHTGGEPVVINFFASWCIPCRAEHDALMALSETHGVRVIGIAYKDAPEDSRAFLAELGDPYSQIGSDLTGRTGIDFGISGVPESFILTPDGRLSYRHWGPIVGNGVETKILPALRDAGWKGERETGR